MKTLVLSVLIIMVFGLVLFSGIESADALKAKGTKLSPKSFGSATKDIVCGDKLCSEITHTKPSQDNADLITNMKSIILQNNQVFELTAGPITKTINGKSLKMLGYNGQTPGPFMTVKQGDQITIKFTNNLDFPTTVHWHGLRLDYTSDGVPKITQEPIPSGGVFEYKLKFPDAGIFVYHPHVRTEMQVDLGLYGNILVESNKTHEAKLDYKVPLILDDIPMTSDGIQEYDPKIVTHTLMGRFGNLMLVNGNPNYSLSVKENDIVRFYLTNTANTRVFNFSIQQHDVKLVSSDVSKYERESFVKSVILAPFERKIVDVLFDKQGSYKIIHSTPEKKYILGKVSVKESNKKDDASFYNISKNIDIIQDVDKYKKYFLDEPKLELEFDLKTKGLFDTNSMHDPHGMDMIKHKEKQLIEWEDEMPKMNAMSNEENTRWILRDTETGKEGFDIGYQAKVGDITKIRLINKDDSAHPMHHPIHLHGQRFLVISEDGVPNDNLAWQDSVLVETGKTIDILVEFSNPGKWIMHCHILEHHEAEMTTEIIVN